MRVFEVKESQAGYYVEKRFDEIYFLRENGELEPRPYDKGEDRFKAKWFPKSGWNLSALEEFDMIPFRDKEQMDRDIKAILNLDK